VRFFVADCPSTGIAALAMTDTVDFALHKYARASHVIDSALACDPSGAHRETRRRASQRALLASTSLLTPHPAVKSKEVLRVYAVRAERIRKTAPHAAARATRLRRARGQVLLTLAISRALASALKRSGVDEHPILVTRRDQRSRAEVPIASAGAAFDDAIADVLGSWASLGVYKEVAYAGQRVIFTR